LSIVSAQAFTANPRPAATVVMLRDGPAGPEVFLVRRHEGMPFMGGAHVFPGGRVDAADYDATVAWCDGVDHAAQQLGTLNPHDAMAYHVAAVRELFEEAGVLLARDAAGRFVSLAGAAARERFKQYRKEVHSGSASVRRIVEREHLRLALDSLVLFAHWVTPPIDARQFDTRFFLSPVPPDQAPVHDEAETTHSAWLTPAAAIAQCQAQEIVLPPPTWTTLRELEPFATVEEAVAWARVRRVVRRQPELVEREGRRMLVMPGDPLHPDQGRDDAPAETRFVSIDGRWRAERPLDRRSST
jgi:8-oxo-dGTP pyrophosphatase MutT (NUDIX family)